MRLLEQLLESLAAHIIILRPDGMKPQELGVIGEVLLQNVPQFWWLVKKLRDFP
jgi:hypothetical protein